MRKSLRMFLGITIVALAVGNFQKIETLWSTDRQVSADEFVVLRDSKLNMLLSQQRQRCGDLSAYVADLASIHDQSDEDDLGYEAMVHTKLNEIVVDKRCVVIVRNTEAHQMYGPFEGSGLVLLSTKGDKIIGAYGQATTSWSIATAPDGWRPDVLLAQRDGIPLEIQLPSSDSVAQTRMSTTSKEKRG